MRGLALSLLTFALPVLMGTSPAAAQLTPRGPEVAVDPDPGIFWGYLLVAGSPDGSACIAWDSEGATGAISPVATLTRNLSVDVVNGLTAIPGGYRLVWTESSYGLKMPKFKMVTVGPDGGIVQRADSLGAAGWKDEVDLTPRPHGGYVATWTGPGALFVELRDEAGRPIGSRYPHTLEGGHWAKSIAPDRRQLHRRCRAF